MNLFNLRFKIRATGFNRYMVECEFIILVCAITYSSVLIDTWWNVNSSVRVFLLVPASVLIDTWWNVNDDGKRVHGTERQF